MTKFSLKSATRLQIASPLLFTAGLLISLEMLLTYLSEVLGIGGVLVIDRAQEVAILIHLGFLLFYFLFGILLMSVSRKMEKQKAWMFCFLFLGFALLVFRAFLRLGHNVEIFANMPSLSWGSIFSGLFYIAKSFIDISAFVFILSFVDYAGARNEQYRKPAKKLVLLSLAIFMIPTIAVAGKTVLSLVPSNQITGKIVFDNANESENGHPYDQIYLFDTEHSELKNLTQSNTHDHSPAVSPDEETVVYVSTSEDSEVLMLLTIDSGERTNLTDLSGEIKDHPSAPTWFPDGKRILYINDNETAEESPKMYIYDLEKGSHVTFLEDFEVGIGPTVVDISPDGESILLVAHVEIWSVISMNIDGSNYKELDNNEVNPQWSEDMSEIVYSSYGIGTDPKIFISNADGTDKREIGTGIFPVWSPDESLILYYHQDFLSVMTRDGTKKRKLLRADSDFWSDPAPEWY